MPSQLRIEYAGAIYHVMNRGDRWEAIFYDEKDRRRLVETLGEVCVRTQPKKGKILMPKIKMIYSNKCQD